MKNYTVLITALLVSVLCLQTPETHAQNKLAQTGLKFLSVSLDARASAMAEAVTSLHGNSASMFYNPAGMANMENYADISLGQTNWIADIDYLHASAAFQPFENDYYGVIGISIVSVDYGEFLQTVRANNDQGFIDVGTYSPTAMAIGVGYARMLSEKFSVGANVKYVRQSIGTGIVGIGTDAEGNESYDEQDFKVDAWAFDFGLIYKTGFKSLNLGMSIRNFSSEIKYVEESFQLPLTFKIGASIDAMDLVDADKSVHSFVVSVDASHPRDFSEQLFIGGEYTFINVLSLRGGYAFPKDEGGFSAGVGLKHDLAGVGLGVDYAYAPFGIFDNVHRISVRFAY